ncbi:MAG: hypothetical protein AB9866_03970 [Syntrophobacteraceae bacterium]
MTVVGKGRLSPPSSISAVVKTEIIETIMASPVAMPVFPIVKPEVIVQPERAVILRTRTITVFKTVSTSAAPPAVTSASAAFGKLLKLLFCAGTGILRLDGAVRQGTDLS